MKSILLVKKLLGLAEMTSGPVTASSNLPEGQAVKMIFFAPWITKENLTDVYQKSLILWNLDIMSLYITKSSV